MRKTKKGPIYRKGLRRYTVNQFDHFDGPGYSILEDALLRRNDPQGFKVQLDYRILYAKLRREDDAYNEYIIQKVWKHGMIEVGEPKAYNDNPYMDDFELLALNPEISARPHGPGVVLRLGSLCEPPEPGSS